MTLDADGRHATAERLLIAHGGVHVHFHRRAHLPIVVASGLLDTAVPLPGGAICRCA